LKRFILRRINRNSGFGNLVHMGAQAVTFAVASRLRFSWLDRIAWTRRSSTLVILGAGRTAGDLTPDQARELEQYDVMALSYGGLLPIRYDVLVSEFAPPAQVPNQIKLFKEVSRRAAASDAPPPLCLWKHPERVTNIEHLTLPVAYVPTIVIPAQSIDSLQRVTSRVAGLGLHRRIMFQSTGSLSALLMAARAKGYGRVIFAGVDLKDRRYFFDDNPDYVHLGLVNPFRLEGQGDLDERHQLASGFRDFAEFAHRLEVAAGPDMVLMVTSRDSALADFWPVYSFTPCSLSEVG